MGSSASKKTPQNTHSYNVDQYKSYSNDIPQQNIQNLRLQSPLKMPIQQVFKCNQCGMVFPTDEALFKHRSRFCIGLKDTGIGRKVYYDDDEEMNGYTNRSRLPKFDQNRSPIDKKRDEINEWKNQRSVLQNVQDMEDRILRDSQKTQRLANDLKKRTYDYNQILVEHEQLQGQERDLLRQMFNLQGQSGTNRNHPNSVTDHETDQLETLQRQNARLEHERRILQNKLEDLIASNHQPQPMLNYEPYKLLRDMKEQQDQNERALLALRKRFNYSNGLISSSYDNISLPYINPYRRTVSDDIRALRYGYLQSGGYDPDILARYSDVEQRLRHYEFYPWMKDYPEPLRHYRYRPLPSVDTAITATANHVITTKKENQRLQYELDHMQKKFERLDSRTRQLELTLGSNGAFEPKSNGYHSYPSSKTDRYPPINSYPRASPRQIHPTFDNEAYDQQQRHSHHTSLPAFNRHTASYTTYNTAHTNKSRDIFEPRSYDPVNGFIIFFDFIINFPAMIDQCRLITCLHHSQSGLGQPSQLQPLKSELFIDETSGERMGMALIATRQPVPSCPPESALSVVLEIQLTSKQAPNEPLLTNAWTKIPLFDLKNRLFNGRWKVPLRKLPIHQNERFDVINTLPTFGRAELYYRLVNYQDGPEQSNATVSPGFKDLYLYPPPVS